MGAWGIGHWLVVLAIVALLFGTKKLRNIGEDVGSAIKGFRKGMQEGEAQQLKADPPAQPGPAETKSERDSV